MSLLTDGLESRMTLLSLKSHLLGDPWMILGWMGGLMEDEMPDDAPWDAWAQHTVKNPLQDPAT